MLVSQEGALGARLAFRAFAFVERDAVTRVSDRFVPPQSVHCRVRALKIHCSSGWRAEDAVVPAKESWAASVARRHNHARRVEHLVEL